MKACEPGTAHIMCMLGEDTAAVGTELLTLHDIKCMLHWVVAMGRGLPPPLLPQEIHLFTHVQEYREFMRRKGLGTPCAPSCKYITTCPWERDTTTTSRMNYHVHLQLYSGMSAKG